MTTEPTDDERELVEQFSKDALALVRSLPQAHREGARKALGGIYGMLLALRRKIKRLEAREIPEYRGVWDAATKYAPASMVTDHGSIFVAKAESKGVRPGTSDAWQLACKRGRNGKDMLPKVTVR